MHKPNQLKKVLLVEDSENDIEITLEALAEYHLANKIDVVRDGAEALDYLFSRGKYATRSGPDPVVVLQEIRATERYRHLPVVMLTSSREEPDLQSSYKLGCNAYVVKPVDFAQFTEALKMLGCFGAVLNEPPAPVNS